MPRRNPKRRSAPVSSCIWTSQASVPRRRRRKVGRVSPEVQCTHLDQIRDVTPSAEGCEDCLRIGGWWVHLRECMSCGHIGCCDSSPNKHATKHARSSGHPIVKSFEPGEDWMWCYVDQVEVE